MTSPVETQYDRLAGAFAQWVPSPRFQRAFVSSVIAWLNETPGQPRRILDAGCGHGTWIKKLLEEVPGAADRFTITGIDLSHERVAVAKTLLAKFPQVRLQQGNLADVELPSELDLIYSAEVFQHIRQPQQLQLLRRWFEALNPGGAVILLDKDFYSRHSFQVELEKLDLKPIRMLLRGRILFPTGYLELAKTIRYPSFRWLRRQADQLGYRGEPIMRAEEFRALILRKPGPDGNARGSRRSNPSS